MKVRIAPSILSFDLTRIGDSVRELERLGADEIHLDVMDGQFVPPITFGDSFVRSLREHTKLPFEAHLMTLTPERQFEPFARAGCSRILFHLEATAHAHRLLGEIHSLGVEAGVALNPGTPVEAVLPLIETVDRVLVMTVNPGWGGQSWIPSTLAKIARLRMERPDLPIEVDGGIGPSTIGSARQAGANVFVVGSYLANAENRAEAFEELRGKCA